jgi:formylglycine-generating enzyme required for sulfatase activity
MVLARSCALSAVSVWLAALLQRKDYMARGTDGRIYPWGNQWEATRCNSQEGGLGEVTSVCDYTQGATPYGLLDIAGNVWERTRSLWGTLGMGPDYRYPYNPSDGRENLDVGRDVFRVLRGGAFGGNRRLVWCACRLGLDPGLRDDFIGFRVVVHS